MQSPSPSTSQSAGANFSSADRLEIYACVRIAKHTLGIKDNTLSTKVYDLACVLMTADDNENMLSHVPSISAVRNLMVTVKETGSVEPRKRTGEPRKDGHDEVEHLLKTTDTSTRGIRSELHPEINVSHMFVHREAKAQKMRFWVKS